MIASLLRGIGRAFVFVGIAELTLRLLTPYAIYTKEFRPGESVEKPSRVYQTSSHAGIQYTAIPNVDVRWNGTQIKFNSLGYRDSEFVKGKHPDVIRIVGIGNSVMMGSGVDTKEDYLSILEESLNRNSTRRYEILNFAISGYNGQQQFYTLRDRALSYRPDLVVIGFVGNDGKMKPMPERLSTPLYLVNFMDMGLKYLWGHKVQREWRHEWMTDSYQPANLYEAYRGMGELLEKHKIPGVIVLDSRYNSPQNPHSSIVNLANKYSIRSINLWELYRDLPEGISISKAVTIDDKHNRLYKLSWDTHSNSKWHIRTAKVLEQRLRQWDLIGEPKRFFPEEQPGGMSQNVVN